MPQKKQQQHNTFAAKQSQVRICNLYKPHLVVENNWVTIFSPLSPPPWPNNDKSEQRRIHVSISSSKTSTTSALHHCSQQRTRHETVQFNFWWKDFGIGQRSFFFSPRRDSTASSSASIRTCRTWSLPETRCREDKSRPRERRERERESGGGASSFACLLSLPPGCCSVRSDEWNLDEKRSSIQILLWNTEWMKWVSFVPPPRMDATPLGRMNEIKMINGCSSRFSLRR
jgi:hypothetical protein